MSDVYELDGTERKSVVRTKIPCGTCVKTSYFVSDVEKPVREDVEIQVDEATMAEFYQSIRMRATANLFPPQGPAEIKALTEFTV